MLIFERKNYLFFAKVIHCFNGMKIIINFTKNLKMKLYTKSNVSFHVDLLYSIIQIKLLIRYLVLSFFLIHSAKNQALKNC